MSLNHFSHPSELQETQWWNNNSATSQQNQHQPPSTFTMDTFHPQLYQNYQPNWLGSQIAQQPPTLNFNLNHDTADGELQHPELQIDMGNDKETMFEKPLTPSDVGKLNRLVIPKQHAEKYFPLAGGSGSGGGEQGGEKGLLLSFEDESGKWWRFRYSYWNSSQSYVLTKGWSRYVKEKRLDAGDVVLFERRRNDSERLFIGWRRRGVQESSSGAGGGGASNNTMSAQVSGSGGGESGGSSTRGGGWTRMFYSAPQSYPAHHHHSVPYPPDYLQHATATAAAGSPVGNQTPSSSSGGNSRILRLFGVNLECQQLQDDESEPSTPDGSSLSSQGPTHHQFYPNNPTNAYYGDHRDFTFSTDANPPMRNRRG